jgi:hypothetical protein
MTSLDPRSSESITTKCKLFSVPPTQTSVVDGFWRDYHPLTLITGDGQVEFCIQNNGESYIDLSQIYLELEVNVTQADGNPFADGVSCVPHNLMLHTMWSDVTVQFNDATVSSDSANYGYRSYIDTLLSYGEAAKKSHLQAALYYKDTPGHMDDGVANNLGLASRAAYSAGG